MVRVAAISASHAGRRIRAQISQDGEPSPHGQSHYPNDMKFSRSRARWQGAVGLHGLLTTGRTEITALGDKVNEGARIEACAMEGRSPASEQLLERLDETDAAALALVVEHLQYIPLGELPHVPDKARRDAPTIAVANL